MNQTEVSEAQIVGERMWGEPKVLLETDDDLIAGTSWSTEGYAVEGFLQPEEYTTLCEGIRSIVMILLREYVPIDERFSLDQYHALIGTNEAAHLAIAKHLGTFSTRMLPIPVERIAGRVGEMCGLPLTTENPHFGGLLSVFGLRIVRPQLNDNNPFHRDHWLNRLRNAVNIYVPIAGSNELSSLPIVPASHHWSEADVERTREGAIVNGVAFTVPAVTGAKKPLSPIRPNPAANEVFVFSPYTVHGGGTNLNTDRTRVSLEMRFWRRK